MKVQFSFTSPSIIKASIDVPEGMSIDDIPFYIWKNKDKIQLPNGVSTYGKMYVQDIKRNSITIESETSLKSDDNFSKLMEIAHGPQTKEEMEEFMTNLMSDISKPSISSSHIGAMIKDLIESKDEIKENSEPNNNNTNQK